MTSWLEIGLSNALVATGLAVAAGARAALAEYGLAVERVLKPPGEEVDEDADLPFLFPGSRRFKAGVTVRS